MRVCVHACVHACVCACVRACVRVCVMNILLESSTVKYLYSIYALVVHSAFFPGTSVASPGYSHVSRPLSMPRSLADSAITSGGKNFHDIVVYSHTVILDCSVL